MRSLLLWACSIGLWAVEPPIPWLPLPALTWHEDHPAPASAALVARAMLIEIYDLAPRPDGKPPTADYFKQEWWWTEGGRSTDFTKACLMVSTSGHLPARKADRQPTILKGESALPGLVRAFVGEGSGVVILVDARGRIVSLARTGADMIPVMAAFDALVPAQGALVPNPNDFSVACAPALNQFKIADVAGGMAWCMRKLGPAGQALAASIKDQAAILADAESDVVSVQVPGAGAADRFIAWCRLRALLAQFPHLGQRPKILMAQGAAAKDRALLLEQAAWASLHSYVAAVGKAPPKKAQAMQKAQLNAIAAKFPQTYANEIAGKIAALLTP